MNRDTLKYKESRAAVQAKGPALGSYLSKALGLTQTTKAREAINSLSEYERAALTVLRTIVGDFTTSAGTAAEYQAVVWLRHSVAGRLAKLDIEARIEEVRDQYELTEANEVTRLQLLCYKKSLAVLFTDKLE